ncbi:hypothetical protein EON81_08670 [bacterium]|nr:MAG: hypothetical protein EON81_08670 [bacterium]
MNFKALIALVAMVTAATIPAVSDAQWQGNGKKVGHYKKDKRDKHARRPQKRPAVGRPSIAGTRYQGNINTNEARRRREARLRQASLNRQRYSQDAQRRRQYESRRLAEQRRRNIQQQRERQSLARRTAEQRRRQTYARQTAQQRRQQQANWNRNQATQWGQEYRRRQDKKNEWRNIAIGSGAVGVLGLLKKDNTLTFAGLGGALYSLNRYEQDRKSQNTLKRTRANYFSRDHFTRDGQTYHRRLVNQNGQRYYQFVRG